MLILLNHTEQTANAGLKNISQIVSRLLLTFDLLHSIDHSRQSKSTLEFLGDLGETMIHLKSSRFCLCGHETLADEVGVGIGANQVESLLEVRKFGLPTARD